MKTDKFDLKLAAVLIAVLFTGLLFGAGNVSATSSSSISISSDADLQSQAATNGWPGEGSASNPYVISDIDLDDPSYGLGIFVHNTTLHMVIEDCIISNSSSYAIDLVSASNVIVRDNLLINDRTAIFLYSCNNCTVYNNTIINAETGIGLLSASYNSISSNSITDSMYNGIKITYSDNNTITGNVISGSGAYGIKLILSNGNVIYGNTFVDNNGAGATYDPDHTQAYDLGSNQWGLESVCNDWGDWASDDPYPYEGSATADEIRDAFPLDEMLTLIIIVVVIITVVLVALVIGKRKAKGEPKPPQGMQATPPVPDAPLSEEQGPLQRAATKPARRAWVPAVAVGVVFIVVLLVVASSMGWINFGKLSGARDIGGSWEGTVTYYTYNIFGEKALRVEATVNMEIDLNGNHVTGTLDMYPTSQTPLVDFYVPEPEEHFWIDGTYEGTTLTFETTYSSFTFEFLTDMATGTMTNTDTNYYLGLKSDPGAFHLTRA